MRMHTAAVATVIVGLAALLSGGGCELAVQSNALAYACEVGVTEACPSGMRCASTNDAGTGTCVALPTAFDGGVTATCNEVLCNCSGAQECTSNICADEVNVTADIYNQAKQWHFCTEPCCTSADCSPGTVCFATGARGNFCVAPGWLGRTTAPGAIQGGATCATNTDCRSGLCANGACIDTCCSTTQSTSECAAGTSCIVGAFPGVGFDKHQAAYCGVSGATAPGGKCGSGTDCTTDFCQGGGGGGGGGMHQQAGGTCRPLCRSGSDCAAGMGCNYQTAQMNGTQDLISVCTSGFGFAAQGSPCTMNSDCTSSLCDPVTSVCTAPCFTDADCTAPQRCLPETVPTTSGTSAYSLLRCGT